MITRDFAYLIDAGAPSFDARIDYIIVYALFHGSFIVFFDTGIQEWNYVVQDAPCAVILYALDEKFFFLSI